MADAMSFRCPKELRDEFSAKAQENGSNASSLLKQFMRQYIENPSILAQTKNTSVNTACQYINESSIDKRNDIQPTIEPADTKNNLGRSILALQKRIDKLEQNTATAKDLDTEKLLKLLEGWSVPLIGINGEVMERVKQLEKLVSYQPQKNEKAKPKRQPSTPNAGDGLSGSALSKRLGCGETSIRRWRQKGNDYLSQRTKERDPDGKAWVFDEQTTMYVESD